VIILILHPIWHIPTRVGEDQGIVHQAVSIPVNPKSKIFCRLFNDQDLAQFKELSLTPKVVIFSFQLTSFFDSKNSVEKRKNQPVFTELCILTA
jgi:hypothetical protein